MTFRFDRDLREIKPPKTDAQFLTAVAKGLQQQDTADETTPEDREALKVKIRQEVIAELSKKIREGTGKPPPEPTPQAQFVRDPSLDPFFALAEAEKEIKRRRRGA